MIRRCLQTVLAALAIVALSPIMAVAALGIYLSDGRPVLYRATRVGRRGRNFMMYKFRTMKVNHSFSSRITAQRDPRIFPFGSLLRRLKIDELPQLFNIIKCDMSFVGPRPEDPYIVQRYYTEEQLETLRVRPGLASPGCLYEYSRAETWLQGNAEDSYVTKVLPLKLALDTIYVREASLLYDLRIVARTLWLILSMLAGRTHFPDPPEMHKIPALAINSITANSTAPQTHSSFSTKLS